MGLGGAGRRGLLGAAMPTRTVEPVTSITSIRTSSPTLIFSPARRVMMSIAGLLLGERSDRDDLLRGRPLEQRGPDGRVCGLVDHLVAATTRDQDRRVEVGTKVLERVGRANRHVDGGVIGIGDPDALGLVVIELDLECGEEPERV